MGTPSLLETQRWMKSRIQPSSAMGVDQTDPFLHPQRGTRGSDRLSVYAVGYRIRMQEALAEVYEALHQVLGEEAFSALAAAYAQSHPSTDYNLSFVGRHLPAFLMDYSVTRPLPFLPDLARLEWNVCVAFHAFEEPPVERRQLATFTLEQWDRMRLRLQPSVSLVTSPWPIHDLWEARNTPRHEVSVDIVNRPQRVMVSRDGWRVRCERLDESCAQLLSALLTGQPLGAACEALSGSSTDQPPPIQEWFQRWMERGLIVEVVSS